MKFEIQINKQGDNSIRYYEHMRSNPDDKNNNKKQDSFGQALRITGAKCKKNVTLNSIQSLLSNRFRIRSGMTKSVNHFLTSLPTNLFTFKPAFTLAEVLITLGIIGIVAAMTIPTLIQKNFEKQTVTKLRETQSILAQAMKMAEEEYGDPSGWGLTGANSESAVIIAKNLKPYLKLAADCGVNDSKYACVSKNQYKRLNGENHGDYAISRNDCYKIALLNGSSIWWRATYGVGEDRLITFWIDVNGKYQPNMYGKDLFVFVYEKSSNSIKPHGSNKKDDYWENSCKKNSTGFGCAYYVLQNQNMNYLHNK